ncbi:hypothetical protein [Nocardia anaemiae]|uniref:hypothetical protein n=1 Tax=Nocardia anaemiae TaxID=263910 RepID=UPI0007A40341|nr:hypothetical protein [Nocardia anaemiae]
MTAIADIPRPPMVRRWALVSLRIVTTAVVVLILLQAGLAGSFLSGNYESLTAHARNGGLLVAALLVQTIVAALAWRLSSGMVQPVIASLAQAVAATTLIPLGQHRILTAHVPLAVLLTIGVVIVAACSWRPGGNETR